MAGADSGTARVGGGAAARSAGRRTAGDVARSIAAGDEIFAERWKAIRRGGCGSGVGKADLVGTAAGVDFEDSWNDGNFAKGIPMGGSKPELRGGVLPGGPSATTFLMVSENRK